MGKKGTSWRIIKLCSLLLLLFLSIKSTPEVASSQDNASEVLRLINQFRSELGLPPFVYNGQLAVAAQQQANWLIANGNNYVHTWPDGTSKDDRARAAGFSGRVIENIVGGYRMSPTQALIWWQNSPVHYQTLVTSRYPVAGTAYARDGDSSRYVLVVGQVGSANQPALPSSADPAPLIVAPVVLSEAGDDGAIIHTVGQGQAIWTLAAYYEVDVADILFYNNLDETSFVSPGDEIIIKPADDWVPPPTPTPSFTHIVQEGQTLWTIAAIHQLPLSDLLLYNGMSSEAFISKGDELIIRLRPGQSPPPTPTPPTTYIAQEGDTFWAIAAINGISLENLYAWNDLTESSLLSPGTELRIAPTPSLAQPAEVTPQPLTPSPSALAEGAALPGAGAVALPYPEPTSIIVPIPSLTPAPEIDQSDQPENGSNGEEVAAAISEAPISAQPEAESEEIAQLEEPTDPFVIIGLVIVTILGILFLTMGGYFVWQSGK